MSQYVCARVTSMKGIDIALFDFDRHNAIYFFVLDADQHIYLRYGGRDADSADTYLDLDSFELALQKGLELHAANRDDDAAAAPSHQPVYPRDIPSLQRDVISRNRCVECHLIGDYQNQEREASGQLDKLRWMYRSPDIKRLGLQLDVPKGLVVGNASGAAAAAGVRAGDRVVALGDQPAHTFGDLQFHYDRTPRDATTVALTVERDGRPLPLTIELPPQWWRTDLGYRHWTVEPVVYFESEPLTTSEKRQLGLPANGFASRVTKVDLAATLRGAHAHEVGDVIAAVDGIATDDVADSAELFVKLRRRAGDEVTLDVHRNGARRDMKLTTGRQSFRK